MSFLPDLKFKVKAVDQFSNTLNKADRRLGSIGKIIGGLGSKLSNVASTAAGVFSGIVGAKALGKVEEFVNGSVDAFSDFEQKLKSIQVFAGITGKEAEKLGEALLEMSSKSVFGVDELQNAMIDLARAGIVGEDAMMLLSAGMTGAMAAGEGLGSTVATALQAIRAFGFGVEQSSHVMDVLINAANVSQASVADLGTALGYVGPIAASAGMKLEDMSAAIAYLTNVGFAASMAGTYLRQSLNNLLNPTDKSKDALKALGVQIYDAQGALKPFPEILASFREQLKGMSRTEVTQALTKVFDVRSATAMAALINVNEEEWNDLRAAIGKSGVASKQASEMMNTYAGSMKKLNAAMEAMRAKLGRQLAPVMLKFTERFNKILPVVSRVIGGLGELAVQVFDVSDAFLAGNWDRGFEILENTYKNIGGKFKKWFDRVDWQKVWNGLKVFAEKLWEHLKEWAGDASQAFIEWWQTIDWREVFSGLADFAIGLWEWFEDLAGNVFDFFKKWVGATDWEAVWDGLKTFAEKLWGKFKEWAGSVSTAFKNWFDTVDWDIVFNNLKTFAEQLWTKIKTWAGDISVAFLNWFGEIDWDQVFNTLESWLENFWDWVFSKVSNPELEFQSWIDQVDWDKVFNSLGEFMIHLPTWMTRKLYEAPANFGDLFWQWIESQFGINIPWVEGGRGGGVPGKQFGGPVYETGLYKLHAGEYVVPKNQVMKAPVFSAQPISLVFNGPLVNVEGSADERTAELAAEKVRDALRNVLVEASSGAAPGTHKRVRVGGLLNVA